MIYKARLRMKDKNLSLTVFLGSYQVVLSSNSQQAEGDITRLSVVPVEWQSACCTRQHHVLLADMPVN